MRIAVTGASGLVGRALVQLAHRRGHEVVAFSRHPEKPQEWAVETRAFAPGQVPDFRGCEAIVHLAGEPIMGLWTPAKRRAIFDSRIQGTRQVIEGIRQLEVKPEVLVSSSAIGYYGEGGETELDEKSRPGTGFLAETCIAWEREALAAWELGVRVVPLRTAVVLARGGGALKLMAPVFRWGLGGVIGSGRQWMSWIHLEDLARLALFAVEDLDLRDPVNATSPWAVRHRDFVQTLAKLLHRPAFFPVPAWAVRLILRGLSAELLESKRVVPSTATTHGFGYRFPELEPALRDLL